MTLHTFLTTATELDITYLIVDGEKHQIYINSDSDNTILSIANSDLGSKELETFAITKKMHGYTAEIALNVTLSK